MRVEKPWGYYEVVSEQDGATMKMLCVYPGQRLSDQYHMLRSEYLICYKGNGGVDLGIAPGPDAAVARQILIPGFSVFVPKGHKHRIFCSSDEPMMIAEVWVGTKLEESDIIRLQDDYGRIN